MKVTFMIFNSSIGMTPFHETYGESPSLPSVVASSEKQNDNAAVDTHDLVEKHRNRWLEIKSRLSKQLDKRRNVGKELTKTTPEEFVYVRQFVREEFLDLLSVSRNLRSCIAKRPICYYPLSF